MQRETRPSRVWYLVGEVSQALPYAFFTNSDFSFIAPKPSILQSIS